MTNYDVITTPILDPYIHEHEEGSDFGFQILSRKQKLKLDLDAKGAAGLRSLIAACIASGINTEEEILDEVSDITGLHSEPLVRLLLTEGDDSDWRTCPNGTYATLRSL